MQKRPLIGIAVPILARTYIQNILRGALAQAHACGCDVIVLSPLAAFTRCTPAHADGEACIYDWISSADFDGFLYIRDDTVMGRRVIDQIESLLLQTGKFVMTVDEREHPIFDSTQYDDYDDFCKVIRHLIEVHHYRRIYCLTGPKDSIQAQTRLRAYQDMMTEYGLETDEYSCTYGTFWVDSAMDYAGRLLSGALPMPEAIVCGNDVTAMSLIKSLQAGGVRVPEDVAVTGYDGFPFAANVDVTLTTYVRNHYQLGADAVRRLFRNMTGILCQKVHRPESGLLIGSSCGCTSVPARQMISRQSAAVPRMWEETVFCDDLAFDLTLAQSLPDLLQRAMQHMDTLYRAEDVRIFLQETDAALLQSGSAAAFLRHTDAPEVLFLSPLHLHDRQFGIIALSFADHDRVYDRSYLHFVSSLELSIDRLVSRKMQSGGEAAAQLHSRSALQDKLEALRDRLRDAPEQAWTIDMLCRESGLGKSTLQKHYKQYFGRSIFEDLIAFRVEKAGQLLAGTALSLREIAARCGYSSESYFMKQFKKGTGMTPTEYRERHPHPPST